MTHTVYESYIMSHAECKNTRFRYMAMQNQIPAMRQPISNNQQQLQSILMQHHQQQAQQQQRFVQHSER